MNRTDIISAIEQKRLLLSQANGRRERFAQSPFKALWFYTLVAINRFSPLLLPIRARTVWGDELRAYETSTIGSLYFLGFYDIDTSLFLLKRYQESGDILDIGSNIGAYALLGNQIRGEHSTVYAFEPTPWTFSILQRNVADQKNIKPVRLALSDTVGTTSFMDYGRRHGVFNSTKAQELPFLQNEGTTIEVKTDTLDNFCSAHSIKPSLIKLDTEGTEARILRRGTHTLETSAPIILLEVGGGEAWAENVKGCFDILRRYTYSFFELDDTGSLIPHAEQEIYQYKNLVCIPERKFKDYVSDR